jgi:hypothetical protein
MTDAPPEEACEACAKWLPVLQANHGPLMADEIIFGNREHHALLHRLKEDRDRMAGVLRKFVQYDEECIHIGGAPAWDGIANEARAALRDTAPEGGGG